MQLCSLASSSSGNCIYIGDNSTNLIVDAGISCKRIEERLMEIEKSASNLDGILITHEHTDHIKSVGIMARRYKIPIYATKNTWLEMISKNSLGKIDPSLHIEIFPDKEFKIKNITIFPFRISHDAIDPVCYTFTKENKKISIATDLGCYNDYIKDILKDSDVLFIEANHDIKMLEVGNYPYFLKQRILSDLGHLSNETSGKLISELLHTNLKHIVLGHLSKENNFPDLASETVKLELNLNGKKDINMSSIFISVAKRSKSSKLIEI